MSADDTRALVGWRHKQIERLRFLRWRCEQGQVGGPDDGATEYPEQAGTGVAITLSPKDDEDVYRARAYDALTRGKPGYTPSEETLAVMAAHIRDQDRRREEGTTPRLAERDDDHDWNDHDWWGLYAG